MPLLSKRIAGGGRGSSPTRTELLVWGAALHLAVDWLGQNEWIADHKHRLVHPAGYVHAAAHGGAQALLFPAPYAAALGLAHLVTDTRQPLRLWKRSSRTPRRVRPRCPCRSGATRPRTWRDRRGRADGPHRPLRAGPHRRSAGKLTHQAVPDGAKLIGWDERTRRSIRPRRPVRVLIVDDIPTARAALRALVESLGHVVVGEARDGAAAVDEVAAQRPDLVLMDYMMPRMDGLSATETITRAHGPVRVIAYTAVADEDTRELFRRAGAVELVGKGGHPRAARRPRALHGRQRLARAYRRTARPSAVRHRWHVIDPGRDSDLAEASRCGRSGGCSLCARSRTTSHSAMISPLRLMRRWRMSAALIVIVWKASTLVGRSAPTTSQRAHGSGGTAQQRGGDEHPRGEGDQVRVHAAELPCDVARAWVNSRPVHG